ncbi:single-stranded DNA-binding protein [Athalassotoga sp.]|uniref:single-stranded DNA-binding protein n=1 Tax=Athalassotoga sp. TaxID=2022597 RepID=UPI003D018051
MNYNRVIMIGRATKEPEAKEKVTKFDIAVNRNKEETDFFRVSCFDKTAEFANSYVKKGKLLLVEGSLRNNSWTDKEGKQRITTEIIANRVEALEKKEVSDVPESWN